MAPTGDAPPTAVIFNYGSSQGETWDYVLHGSEIYRRYEDDARVGWSAKTGSARRSTWRLNCVFLKEGGGHFIHSRPLVAPL